MNAASPRPPQKAGLCGSDAHVHRQGLQARTAVTVVLYIGFVSACVPVIQRLSRKRQPLGPQAATQRNRMRAWRLIVRRLKVGRISVFRALGSAALSTVARSWNAAATNALPL